MNDIDLNHNTAELERQQQELVTRLADLRAKTQAAEQKLHAITAELARRASGLTTRDRVKVRHGTAMRDAVYVRHDCAYHVVVRTIMKDGTLGKERKYPADTTKAVPGAPRWPEPV